MIRTVLILASIITLTGCASALLQTIEEESIRLDAKSLEWVKENRDRICEKAMIDPLVLTALNEGIANKLIHPEFCELEK